MFRIPQFLLFSASLLILSCNSQEDEEAEVVARVYEDVLTFSDLADRMPSNYAKEDSARLAQVIVNKWIREKAVLNFAEANLADRDKDFTKQLNEYRNSLVTYAYERKLINQKLDTIISEREIEAYYKDHIDNFQLRTYIIKPRFVKLDKEAPRQKKLEEWFLSDSEKDFDKLYDYCLRYAENYYFEEDAWLYLEEFLKEVPIVEADWSNFLKKTTYYKFESGSFQYLVRILDYRLKGDRSPLSLERKTIRDLILNKRKIELIDKMRDDVVNEAFDNGKIKILKE
jgi:hypothetical protein